LTHLLDEVNASLRRLVTEADHIKVLVSRRTDHTSQLVQISEWAEAAAANLPFFTYAEKRLVLYLFGTKVFLYRTDHVGPDGQLQRHRIEFNFDGLEAGLVPLPAKEQS
jgi:hypothetical protein